VKKNSYVALLVVTLLMYILYLEFQTFAFGAIQMPSTREEHSCLSLLLRNVCVSETEEFKSKTKVINMNI
jgi:hypothetical protein